MGADDASIAAAAGFLELLKGVFREIVREELPGLQGAVAPTHCAACATRAAAPAPLLTVEDIARRLQVTEPTVREWIRQGRLSAFDLAGEKGKRHEYRVSEEQLQAFLSGQGRKGAKTVDHEALASNIVRLQRGKGTERM